MPLTDAAIRNAQPADKPRKLSDSKALYLLIRPNGGKYWRWKYRFGGKEKSLALGVYPDVSLKDARERRDEACKLLADGIDPAEHKKAVRLAEREAQARQLHQMRSSIADDGALSIRLGARRVDLTPQETTDLRIFLNATSAVGPQGESCR